MICNFGSPCSRTWQLLIAHTSVALSLSDPWLYVYDYKCFADHLISGNHLKKLRAWIYELLPLDISICDWYNIYTYILCLRSNLRNNMLRFIYFVLQFGYFVSLVLSVSIGVGKSKCWNVLISIYRNIFFILPCNLKNF